jgi:putative phosphoribosyl transferase
MTGPRFADRAAAGRALAERLDHLAGRTDVLVLGLPRGGVVVAARVAEHLNAPLDVVVARKLRCPGADELAMGAVAVWGTHSSVIRNDHVIGRARVAPADFETARLRELDVARHRAAEWGQLPPDVRGRVVVLVDDGLATGATMHASIAVLREARAARLIAAVPVAPPEELRTLGVEVACVHAPAPFRSVGTHYADFTQIEDGSVLAELQHARDR